MIRSETGRATETAAVAQWMIGETYFMQKQYNQAIKAYHRVEGLYDFPALESSCAAAGRQVPRNGGPLDRSDRAVRQDRQGLCATRSFADKAAKRLQRRTAASRLDAHEVTRWSRQRRSLVHELKRSGVSSPIEPATIDDQSTTH